MALHSAQLYTATEDYFKSLRHLLLYCLNGIHLMANIFLCQILVDV